MQAARGPPYGAERRQCQSRPQRGARPSSSRDRFRPHSDNLSTNNCMKSSIELSGGATRGATLGSTSRWALEQMPPFRSAVVKSRRCCRVEVWQWTLQVSVKKFGASPLADYALLFCFGFLFFSFYSFLHVLSWAESIQDEWNASKEAQKRVFGDGSLIFFLFVSYKWPAINLVRRIKTLRSILSSVLFALCPYMICSIHTKLEIEWPQCDIRYKVRQKRQDSIHTKEREVMIWPREIYQLCICDSKHPCLVASR